MTKEKEAENFLAGITDLELDTDALQELIAAARISQQAQEPALTVDDTSTVVLPATASDRPPPPPAVPPKNPHTHLFATKYASNALLKSHASLIKAFLDTNKDKTRDLINRYQAYETNKRPCFVICTSTPKP